MNLHAVHLSKLYFVKIGRQNKMCKLLPNSLYHDPAFQDCAFISSFVKWQSIAGVEF